ncbi:hypothetical protein R1flu_007608 [Riccia fluitans]|uniref:Structural maintenance of chromosomes protein 5 n=1 Tax=Riccia fluitans TaxID=41844 RepID=A0ABD1Z221_9MARC
MTQPSSARPSKRVRTACRGEDDYAPGNIIEIEVHNFMTYGHIKSKPGPRLNLVIGPNGTGKSSLVCAICIGLGGEPQLLGRATMIGDFVKRGEESGWTKISLRGNSANEAVVITRRINIRNKSDWSLNDRSVNKKDIHDVVQGFNIQLNNLTQFLPQDRVCEFAKLTPIQLLEETEKAVGDPELSFQHKKLIEMSEELKKLQTTIRQLESSLAQYKASNRDIEEDGQRMRQRNDFLKKAELLKKKLPWLKYDEKKAAYQTAKEAENVAKNKLGDVRRNLDQMLEPYEDMKTKKLVAEEASKKMLSAKSDCVIKMNDRAEKESQLCSQVRSKKQQIAEAHLREVERQQNIQKAQQDLATAEAEFASLPDYQPPTAQIKEIADRLVELQTVVDDTRNLKEDKERQMVDLKMAHGQCSNKLQEINNVNSRLLNTLQKSGAHGIFEAYKWVQSQREQNKFKNEVYGPVLLEVQIPDKTHAAYIENQVAGHIWRSFITLDPEDRDLCVRELKQHGCPVINQTQVQRAPPPPLTHEMRQLGITMRLDQAINAPEVVKQVLCGQSGLEQSFIGGSDTNLRADEAPSVGIQDLWTPENHYRWQRSRYGGHISASVNPVRPVRLFSENVDVGEKTHLEMQQAELEDSMRQLQTKIMSCVTTLRDVDAEQAKHHREREELYNQVRMEKKKRADMLFRIEQRRKKKQMYENEESSEIVEAKLMESIQNLNGQRLENVIKLKDAILAIVKKQAQYAAHHLNVIELDAKVKEIEKDVLLRKQACLESERDYGRCKEVTEARRSELQNAKEDAERAASLTPSLQGEFNKMPDTVEELEELISEAIDSANAVICNNPNVLEEYERRCKLIESVTEKVEKEKASLDRCMNEIKATQDLWSPRLRELVSKINETFSRNFMEMAIAGEVTLDEHGTDFDKYGILIKVKFRETAELQVLSAHHQSGGERSVSTILYLVSLQDLTYCPFRVVDEINQGMDPNNERKMFQQLVRAASQPNTPQCLLLTPKLLPNLDYTEACTVLNIMNGPWLEGASTVWSAGQSWTVMSQMVCSQ